MKTPDAPLADDSVGLHEQIEEYLGGYEQAGNLPAKPAPVRANTSPSDGPELWRPRKGDRPAKDGPLTIQEIVAYCDGQTKEWQKQARADDFKEMKCCDAYSLLAQQAKRIAGLLKRVKAAPARSVPSDNAGIAKRVVNTLLSKIPSGAKVISTADALDILVRAFPDLFDGAASLRGAGKRLRGLLQGLDVCPDNVRTSGKVVKGYQMADLQKALV